MIGLMFAAFYSAAYYFKHMMFSAPGQLRGHGRADAGLDAVAFALAHAAVEAHHEVVRVRSRINGAPTSGTHSSTS